MKKETAAEAWEREKAKISHKKKPARFSEAWLKKQEKNAQRQQRSKK